MFRLARHLGVDLGGDAARHYVQVDVVLLVQAQVAVTQQVQRVDTPESRGAGCLGGHITQLWV